MLRSGQMLFSAFLKKAFGDSRLKWFIDTPDALYGIHSICTAGLTLGKQPGEWHGAGSILQSLDLLTKQQDCGVHSVICKEGNIFLLEIESAVARGKPVFVGLPIQLGVDTANPEYLECVKRTMCMDQCVGIAGGLGSRSFYFWGLANHHTDDPILLYHDPHVTQPAITSESEAIRSNFSTGRIR